MKFHFASLLLSCYLFDVQGNSLRGIQRETEETEEFSGFWEGEFGGCNRTKTIGDVVLDAKEDEKLLAIGMDVAGWAVEMAKTVKKDMPSVGLFPPQVVCGEDERTIVVSMSDGVWLRDAQ